MLQVNPQLDTSDMIIATSDLIESFAPDLDSEVQAWKCVAMQLAKTKELVDAANCVKVGIKEAVRAEHIELATEPSSALDSILGDYLMGTVSIGDLTESVKTH